MDISMKKLILLSLHVLLQCSKGHGKETTKKYLWSKGQKAKPNLRRQDQHIDETYKCVFMPLTTLTNGTGIGLIIMNTAQQKTLHTNFIPQVASSLTVPKITILERIIGYIARLNLDTSK